MKKIAFTIAIVFGLNLGSFAQWGGGIFQRGALGNSGDEGSRTMMGRSNGWYDAGPLSGLAMPDTPIGSTDNSSAETPLGGGVLLLIGFSAAYAMGKRNRK